MGKNVLKIPGIVHACPAASVQIILVIMVVGVMSGASEEDHSKILERFNMTRMPRAAQSNISQTEFETKHREYFDLVEQNQRRRLNSSLNDEEENIVRKKLYRFTHSGLESSRSPNNGIENRNLHYNIHIPPENNSYFEVEKTYIRLLIVPKNCARENEKAIALKVVRNTDNSVIRQETFRTNECLPQWISLDVTEGFSLSEESFSVTVKCEDCMERNIVLTDPYLNVIVNVKSRLRRRRAEKSRRRYAGKCGRQPLEVDFKKLQGYEFIIQPTIFDAGLCAGRCPKKWNPASRHSTLQYLLANMDKRIPKPCCAPSKMAELEILHQDEDDNTKLKVSIWENTKIIECACS